MRAEVFSGTDDFLRWVFGQETWIELEDGLAVSMPASTQARSVIATNLVCSLVPSARRRGYRATGQGTAVVTGDLTVRFPAVILDAGAPDPTATAARDPILIAEIRTDDGVDWNRRVAEYREVPEIETIVLVDAGRLDVEVHRMSDGSWTIERLTDPNDVVLVGRIDTRTTLADIYDGAGPCPEGDRGPKTI